MKSASVVLNTLILGASFTLAPPAFTVVPDEPPADTTPADASWSEPAPTETSAIPLPIEVTDPISADTGDAEVAIRNYLLMIDELESDGNSYDIRLAESTYGLGAALQRVGQHQKAIAAFQRAMQITRINDGIYSTSQEPMLRGMIESQKAIHDVEAAASHYQHLLWINSKSRGQDDPILISLLGEISQWHLDTYQHEPGRNSVNHLLASYNLSLDAIDLAASRYGPSHLRIIPLLKSVISTSYYMARHQTLYPAEMSEEPTFSVSYQSPVVKETESPEKRLMASSYSSGRAAYERIIQILDSNNTISNREKAEAYAELGDWYLLFGRRSSARSAYLEANRIISEDSDQEQLAREIFGTPKMLPINLTGSEVQENTHQAILVEFDVMASGNVRNINVLDSNPEVKTSQQATVRNALRDAKFRPAFVNGEPTEVRGIKLRVKVAEG